MQLKGSLVVIQAFGVLIGDDYSLWPLLFVQCPLNESYFDATEKNVGDVGIKPENKLMLLYSSGDGHGSDFSRRGGTSWLVTSAD